MTDSSMLIRTDAGSPAAASLAGTLRFIRYAFMPNRLQYCGGDDNATLLEHAVTGEAYGGVLPALRKFTGAMPYLSLIARENEIADPFDVRVVEAYWLGNELLDRVEVRGLYDSLRERYRKQLSPRLLELASWRTRLRRWRAAGSAGGASRRWTAANW
jgi:hypothetical protein